MICALGDKVPDLAPDVWIADNARVIGYVVMGEQSSVWFNTVIRGDNELISIGARTNIQDNSVLHTDYGFPLTIGMGVTVGHRAMLHGCNIGENSLIGIGATLLNGVVIGKNCLIGAHALVTEGKHIPDNSVVMGMPAKVIKSLDGAGAKLIEASAAVYVENAKRFAETLRSV